MLVQINLNNGYCTSGKLLYKNERGVCLKQWGSHLVYPQVRFYAMEDIEEILQIPTAPIRGEVK